MLSLKFIKKISFCFFVIINLKNNLCAKELPEYGLSVRALGMGNAYISVVENYEALWYNPAALSRVKGINIAFIDLNAGINGENAYNSALDLADSQGDGLDSFSTLFGDQIWIGLGGKAALTLPYFGFGVYDSGNASLELKNPMLPGFDVVYTNDYGLVLGGAFAIGERGSFGLNLKRITRTGVDQLYGISTFIDGSTSNISSDANRTGSAYGIDVGFTYTQPGVVDTTFSGVIKDLGKTSFISENDNRPHHIDDEQILGVAFKFDAKIFDATAAIDYKHINEEGEQFSKKMHMGLELGLPLVQMRAGFSQGYYTMGLTFDLFLFRFDVASYGVELGEYGGQDEDRRFMAQLIMEFGFDPSFNLIDIKGSRGRKLKQRR